MAKRRGLFLYSSSCPSHQSGFPKHSKLISASGPLHFHFLCRDHTSIRFCRAASFSHTHILAQISPLQRGPPCFHPPTHTSNQYRPIHPPSIPLPCLLSSQRLSFSEVILILVCYLFTCLLAVSPRHGMLPGTVPGTQQVLSKYLD